MFRARVIAALIMVAFFTPHLSLWAVTPTEYDKNRKDSEGKFLPKHLQEKQKKIESVIEIKQELIQSEGSPQPPITDTLKDVLAASLGVEIQTDITLFTEGLLSAEDIVQAYPPVSIDSVEEVMAAEIGDPMEANIIGYTQGGLWHVGDILNLEPIVIV